MNNRQRGKNTERALAKKLGAKRVGVLGKEDINHSLFSIEVKHRKRIVIEAWMQQAERNCEAGKTPLLIIHQLNKKHSNDIVCMRLKDFEDYLWKLWRTELDYYLAGHRELMEV